MVTRLQLIVYQLLFVICLCKQDKNPTIVYHEGKTGAGNSTRFELNAVQPLRIVLQSISGDADLYVSYKTADVSFLLEEHDGSSTTCGLDYIDIPALPRPSYLAVYGHPSHATSTWRILVITGKNSTYSQGDFDYPPEIIFEWEDGEKSEEDYDSGGLVSLLIEILEIIITILAS